MRLTFTGLSTLFLLCAAGCAATSPDAASNASADTSASAIWNPTLADTIYFQVGGAGEVPRGSACAPGAGRYTVAVNAGFVLAWSCTGAPLRWTSRVTDTLPDDTRAKLIAAMAGLSVTPVSTCPVPSSGPFVSVSIGQHDGTTVTFEDDTHACGETDPRVHVTGVPAVLATIAPFIAGLPLDATKPVAERPPTTFWSPAMTSLMMSTTGSGHTPVGSACVLGSDDVRVDVHADGSWWVTDTSCDQPEIAPEQPTHTTTRTKALDEQTKDWLVAALQSVPITSATTCVPDAPYVNVDLVSAAPTHLDEFRGVGTACDARDVGPFADMTKVVSVLAEYTYGD